MGTASEQTRQDLQHKAKELMAPFVEELAKYEVPEDKEEGVIDFAVKTFAKYHRSMKLHRIVRKVVEEFKLKLKEDESDKVQRP